MSSVLTATRCKYFTLMVAALLLSVCLCACSGGDAGGQGSSDAQGSSSAANASPTPSSSGESSSAASDGESAEPDAGETSGPAYEIPASIEDATFNAGAAEGANDALIDVSNAAAGYVGASAQNASRLKFQVIKGEMSYNYDLPGDGTPIICPLNMGDGSYTLAVMQNTSGNNYVEVFSTTVDVALESQFAPFLRPSIYCDFNNDSACVKKARELAQGAQNEGDVARAIYEWITESISYDTGKAAELAQSTGYYPNPDDTFSSKTGVCFDYASLAAAMFRSLGIPCQIITGYVSPDNLYHAWNMVYLDGQWVSVQLTINPDTWTRLDTTFAASGGGSTVGDGTTYTDRYVY